MSSKRKKLLSHEFGKEVFYCITYLQFTIFDI